MKCYGTPLCHKGAKIQRARYKVQGTGGKIQEARDKESVPKLKANKGSEIETYMSIEVSTKINFTIQDNSITLFWNYPF